MGFKKIVFKYSKFKHKRSKYKEIELEKSNSYFIMVRHFFTYVHSPQTPNWMRVPLTWSFNQTTYHIYTWILAPMNSYTIFLSFNSLGVLTLNLQIWISQSSSKKAQIQLKARMNHKMCTKGYVNEI